MNIIYIALGVYLLIGFTWFFYLAAMHLKHNKDNINHVSKFFGMPWIIFAVIGDVLFNWIIGTLIFLEVPREFLFTTRITRHLQGQRWNKWRGKIAVYFCKNLLDPFDPSGSHCK